MRLPIKAIEYKEKFTMQYFNNVIMQAYPISKIR
jgi:hypothetical protein